MSLCQRWLEVMSPLLVGGVGWGGDTAEACQGPSVHSEQSCDLCVGTGAWVTRVHFQELGWPGWPQQSPQVCEMG